MSLAEITLNGEAILVEVAEIGGATGRFEYTAAPATEAAPGDLGRRLEGLLGAMTGPVQRALAGAAADEWSIEVSVGFTAGGGVPFLATGEANGALKVTAKWKRATADQG